MTLPVILTIAGTDPTAGAGLQADCKTITALGGYAVSAITAVVAQNTQGVTAVSHLSPELLRAQLDAITADTTLAAIKIGMLGSHTTIATVKDWLTTLGEHKPPVILDPVMVATSGHNLSDPHATSDLKELITVCDLVTPNTHELAALTHNQPALTFEDALLQGHQLARDTNTAVVIKGGHIPGPQVHDALITPTNNNTTNSHPHSTVAAHTTHPRVHTHRTHGTGCALSSAIATQLAHHPGNIVAAFTEAKNWLHRAIKHADSLAFGKGNGPIHHTATIADDAVTDPAQQLIPAPEVDHTLHEWWEASAPVREHTDHLPFVQQLAHGTLPPEQFAHYLEQDALYLREYSKALAVAAELAPTLIEQRFWIQGAYSTLIIERALHDSWLAHTNANLENPHPTPTTTAYTQHFLTLARARDYPELIAALLPCYWMYHDIGTRLTATHQRPDHPYTAWLAAYADPKFTQSTQSARTIVAYHVRTLQQQKQHHVVTRMRHAFLTSCQHEHDFFNIANTAHPSIHHAQM